MRDVAPTGDPLVDGGIDAFMIVVTVVMALGVLLFVRLLVRNVRTVRCTGRGRVTSLSRRLQELDDLHRRAPATFPVSTAQECCGHGDPPREPAVTTRRRRRSTRGRSTT